jgi:hypothetical protein
LRAHCESRLPQQNVRANQITLLQRLLITLTCLRHGISQQLVAFIFGCSQPTVSRILHETVYQLYDLADDEIQLPEQHEKDELYELQDGKQIVLVVDGAEQRVQSSDFKLLQNINFSGKKHLHTFTKLIAVDPVLGKIRFISNSYPGSVTSCT